MTESTALAAIATMWSQCKDPTVTEFSACYYRDPFSCVSVSVAWADGRRIDCSEVFSSTLLSERLPPEIVDYVMRGCPWGRVFGGPK